VFKKQH